MVALPAPIQELWNVWREIERKAARPVAVALIGQEGPEREHWKDAFLIGSHYPHALITVGPDDDVVPTSDLYLVIATASGVPVAREFPVLSKLPQQKIVVALVGVPEHLASLKQRETAHQLELAEDQVVPVANLKQLAGPFARRLGSLFSDFVIPLARQFPVLREALAMQEVEATAKQNALVGIVPLPGAHLPIMTANEFKMVMRIAAMYDQPMTLDRARELVAVVAGGFGMRALARSALRVIPLGPVVGGAVGYGGTLAMGKGAIEYFRRMGRPVRSEAEPMAELPAGKTE